MKRIFLAVMLLAVHTYSFSALVITSSAPLYIGASTSWTTLDINEAHRNESACNLSNNCVYGVLMRYYGALTPNGAVSAFNNNLVVSIKNGTTWGEAQSLFAQRFGRSGSSEWTSWTWTPTKWEVCVGTLPRAIGSVTSLVLQNPSDCSLIPPIGVSCSVTNKVDIDHGTLSASAVHGSKGIAVANLSCTSPVKVRAQFLPRIIDMGGGITSTISIDGIRDGDVIEVDRTINLTFVSLLSSSGATIGVHQGSSVVVFDIL